MADDASARRVQLDLNNEGFQDRWLALEKSERERVADTFRKWGKLISVKPPTIRITRSRRATAYRQGNYMRFLTIATDHDAAYGKK